MLTKEQARQEIQLLVNKYKRIRDAGRIKEYNEERTKKDLALEMFGTGVYIALKTFMESMKQIEDDEQKRNLVK